MNFNNISNIWGLAAAGFFIVLVGLFLKDANSANTLLGGFANAYTSTLSTLEKAG